MGCVFKLTAVLALATSSQVALVNAAVAQFNPLSNPSTTNIVATGYDGFNRQLLGKDEGLPEEGGGGTGTGTRLFDDPHNSSDGMPAEEENPRGAGSR